MFSSSILDKGLPCSSFVFDVFSFISFIFLPQLTNKPPWIKISARHKEMQH